MQKREKKVNRSIHPQYQTYVNTHIPPIQNSLGKISFLFEKKNRFELHLGIFRFVYLSCMQYNAKQPQKAFEKSKKRNVKIQ